MNIGSLFSGIGGLDWACERAWPGARTAWQLDLIGAGIRRRHWPDAVQVEADIRTVSGRDLVPVDILCGGFPCQDLSCAGTGAGLDGARSGLYGELLRLARELRPTYVVMENVPGLLRYMDRLSDDCHALGYGLTWAVCGAVDAGHPHLRRRVFVLAELGAAGGGCVDVDAPRRWTPEGDERRWATVTASNPNEGEDPASWEARRRRELAKGINGNGIAEPLAQQVRMWATIKATDARSPGRSRSQRRGADGLACEIRTWPTVTEHGNDNRTGLSPTSGDGLGTAVRPWPTPCARDYKTGELPHRDGGSSLSTDAAFGRRLNPDWVEALMGYPPGWTRPNGPHMEIDADAPAVRGRYPANWDRSVPWLGYDWEPSRVIPAGPPVRGRPARIRAVGNAVCPQQGALALMAMLSPAQLVLGLPGVGQGSM